MLLLRDLRPTRPTWRLFERSTIKNPTKKAKIARRKFRSYLRNKRLPLWQHICFRWASQMHFYHVSQTCNKFFDKWYFTVIMFLHHLLLMYIWGTAKWNLLVILEGNINWISDLITTKKGLREGDSLACLLFNLALEKVRNAGIQTSGTIFYKSVQLLAYADDVDIIARSRMALKEAFLSLERAAGEMGLRINEGKTKYLTTRDSKNQQRYFQIKNFNFEAVQSFTYLGPPHKC